MSSGSRAARPHDGGAGGAHHPAGTASGPGRVLVAVYAVLALAATFRSGVQILRDFEAAPVAYTLSAVAAVVYVVATVALARGARGVWRPVAWTAVTVELVGVLVVGALSVAVPRLFADATVWSGFGSGYGFVPLVLPVLGLLWLRRAAPDGRPGTAAPVPDPAR